MSDPRYEIKFALNEVQFNEILIFIKQQNFKKSFPERKVNSLYFDSHDFKSVKDNISGVALRNKVRLRWYEKSIEAPIIEIKKRIGRVGDKLKIKSPFKSYEEIEKLNSKEIGDRIFKTNFNNLSHLNLNPVLFVNYNRKYFKTNEGIRLTVDRNIKFSPVSYYNSLDLQKKMNYNKIIVEIKFPLELKTRVSNLIRLTRLTPTRHSKYLLGMSKIGYSSYI